MPPCPANWRKLYVDHYRLHPVHTRTSLKRVQCQTRWLTSSSFNQFTIQPPREAASPEPAMTPHQSELVNGLNDHQSVVENTCVAKIIPLIQRATLHPLGSLHFCAGSQLGKQLFFCWHPCTVELSEGGESSFQKYRLLTLFRSFLTPSFVVTEYVS